MSQPGSGCHCYIGRRRAFRGKGLKRNGDIKEDPELGKCYGVSLRFMKRFEGDRNEWVSKSGCTHQDSNFAVATAPKGRIAIAKQKAKPSAVAVAKKAEQQRKQTIKKKRNVRQY